MSLNLVYTVKSFVTSSRVAENFFEVASQRIGTCRREGRSGEAKNESEYRERKREHRRWFIRIGKTEFPSKISHPFRQFSVMKFFSTFSLFLLLVLSARVRRCNNQMMRFTRIEGGMGEGGNVAKKLSKCFEFLKTLHRVTHGNREERFFTFFHCSVSIIKRLWIHAWGGGG